MGDFMKEWYAKYGYWEEIEDNTLIEKLKELEPVKTGSSLHIYEEVYAYEGETYRLLYAISNTDSLPTIEKKIG